MLFISSQPNVIWMYVTTIHDIWKIERLLEILTKMDANNNSSTALQISSIFSLMFLSVNPIIRHWFMPWIIVTIRSHIHPLLGLGGVMTVHTKGEMEVILTHPEHSTIVADAFTIYSRNKATRQTESQCYVPPVRASSKAVSQWGG